MCLKEARTWALAPEDSLCTLHPTGPPGSTDLTGARNDPAAPRAQTSLGQHQ